MFTSKLPWLYVLQILLVCVAVVVAIVFTGNALALLALMLVWSPPPLVMDPTLKRDSPEDDSADARSIGFVQDDEEE